MTLWACLSVLAACSPGVTPCATPVCTAGYECLANRCVPRGADPVPPGTERLVLEPVAVAVAEPRGGPGIRGVRQGPHGNRRMNRAANAATATLGSGSAEASTLYLRFPNSWKRNGVVAAAFLVLSPSGGTEPGSEDVPILVSAIGDSWSMAGIGEGRLPFLTPPRAAGLARGSPRTLVRVDVTRVVRALSNTPWDDGIAVTAASSVNAWSPGVTLSTGGGAGETPRLELYLDGTSRTKQ
jgi:hypothetical protein